MGALPAICFAYYGGAEDSTWNVVPVQKMAAKLAHTPGVDLQYRLYPHLDHMDVAQLSFIQGLRHFYPVE